MALRAPSVHNTQPWRWRLEDNIVHLFADERRRLPHTDPDCRELVMSCGAALHHLCVAMRAFGWESEVHRLPDSVERRCLATVSFHRADPDAESIRLARAISRRRSDRRHFAPRAVPRELLQEVAAAAAMPGIRVHSVDSAGEWTRLVRAFRSAAADHAGDPGYAAELAAWSGRHGAALGIPAGNAVLTTDPTARPFDDPRLPDVVVEDHDRSRMLLVSCRSNNLLGWLRAGEATSAVLLTATARGLATCPLSEPMELPRIRERIRTGLLGGSGYPLLLVRLGWAARHAGPVPATPRLPLEVLLRQTESTNVRR